MMGELPVTFYYPHPEELAVVEGLEVDADWGFFSTGPRIWTAQTHLRLREAGYSVTLSSELPHTGIVAFFPEAESLTVLMTSGVHNNPELINVALCGDRGRFAWADFEIVQNRRYANGKSVIFIPCWPQPGLIPRNAERGTKVSRIAFKGYASSLNAMFRSEQWLEYLRGSGIAWVEDVADWQGNRPGEMRIAWNDYSEVDLVIAVREDEKARYENKPASKLVNAWMAGVPALLGAEYAYWELRRSELDYAEVDSVEAAIAAVEQLRSDPERYRDMVENGKQRAMDFRPERLVERWAALLFEELPRLASSPAFKMRKRLPLRVKALTR